MNLRLRVATCVVLATSIPSSTARAAPEDAESLFEEGRRALADKRYDEACPLLARSHSIDPAEGTLLALGLCHEQAGDPVAAWGELSEVLARSIASAREDRQRVARAALARVAQRVARITFKLEGSAEGVTVTSDGRPIPMATSGREVAVTPGAHDIEAHRDDAVVWKAKVDVATGASTVVVVPIPERPLSKPEPEAAPSAAPPVRESGGRPWLGYAIGGVGLGALAVGGVFGVQSFTSWGDVEERCDPAACADVRARSDYEAADRAATVSNVLVGAGIGLIAIGATILLWPREPARASRAILPRAGALLSAGF